MLVRQLRVTDFNFSDIPVYTVKMITRQLALWIFGTLVIATSAQYAPVSSIGDDNDCALYLTGPGRTSAYDYNLNLLRGSFPYDGQYTCITYDAVNAAYIDARKRINVAAPKGDWKTEDIASVGELLLDISINLARTYGLTYEDIEKGLPLIDTAKTLIRDVCPPFLSHVECRPGKYRRFDGLCTNLQHPTWGASMTPFQRLLAPLYGDGINAPRVSVTGNELPPARIVSRTMHPDEGFHDHAGTVMVIAWGQFMDHDYTLTGTPLDPKNRNDPEECCNRPPHQKHPYCNELRIPDDDYFYRLFNIKCIDFVRGFPHPRPGCRLGSRAQFNTLTGVIDGNTVYGVSEKFSRKLRSGHGGLLRMNPVFEEYGLKDLLPLKLDIPDEGCTRPDKSMYCFEAGEIRVNEQLVLSCMHTLMAREHNRVARGLAEVNPHWDDETLFQESRRIIIAEIQHITYNEFLPILLGKEVMEKFGLLLEKESYWDGYDENINPNVIDAFAAAAFRFGHSLLPTTIERWSKAHKFISSKRLSDLIRRPFDLYRAGIFDEYLMGLMNQVAQAMDDSITQEVTNHLFKKPGARFGMDLVSFNMQRGREFGLPGYMEFRKFCGLPGANSFQELFGSMTNETILKYESIFEHPSDVDLWSGGVSERPLPGSMLGPTFACVIATQFSYSRRGDRFWYELPNQPSSFTPEQLAELRKARLSRVICDNTDIIDTVQVYPMVLPDHQLNPRVPCRSGILPSIDFTKWADYSGHRHYNSNPYIFVTEANIKNYTNVGNSTQPIEKHTGGHYKNALRRKRSVNTTHIQPLTKDSQTAAIIVSQVTGSDEDTDNIPTTAKTIPRDSRKDTSPQTFPPKTSYDQSYYYDPNFNKYYGIEDEVSHQENEEDVENEEEDPNEHNQEQFIPDKEDAAQDESEESQDSKAGRIVEEHTDNEEFPGNSDLELDGVSNDDEVLQTRSTDESYDLNSNSNNCSTDDATHPSDNGVERGAKLIRRGCEDSSGSVERVENPKPKNKKNKKSKKRKNKKNKNKNHDDEIQLQENLKEQFEFIPLNYKHTDEEEEQNPKYETENSSSFPFNIDLGDTTVEIENITLPDNVLGYYKEEYVDEDQENNEDGAENGNEDSEEDQKSDEENQQNKKDKSDNKKEENDDDDDGPPFYFTDEDKNIEEDDFIPGYVDFDANIKKKDDANNEPHEEFEKYIEDPQLKSAVGGILEKSRKTEGEAGSDDDPKYNYFWSLEYSQPK